MKKLLMILMMVFVVGCSIFAKPIIFDAGEYTVLTDDENEQHLAFTRCSDDIQRLNIIISAAPEEIDGRRLVLECFFINDEVSWIAEKYYNYFFIKNDRTAMMICHNLGDGREIVLSYRLELIDDE